MEFADAEEALQKRVEMPVELFERDYMPEELVERDFSPIEVEELERRGLHDFEIEELERRGISQGAKNFWKKVGNGVRLSYIFWGQITDKFVFNQAEHVFEQLGPLALQIGAHAAGGRGHATSAAPAAPSKPSRRNTIG